MRDRDTAESSLASCSPEPIRESLGDLLREAVAPFILTGSQPRAFAAIDGALTEYEDESGVSVAPAAAGTAGIFELIRSVFEDSRIPEETRLRAVAVGIASGDPTFNRSYQHYADGFAVTRANVHALSRNEQETIGIRNRRDKSDDARTKSRLRASGPNHHQRTRAASPRRLHAMFPGL